MEVEQIGVGIERKAEKHLTRVTREEIHGQRGVLAALWRMGEDFSRWKRWGYKEVNHKAHTYMISLVWLEQSFSTSPHSRITREPFKNTEVWATPQAS